MAAITTDIFSTIPATADIVGDEAYTARYEQNRTLKMVSALLAGLLTVSVSANAILATRKPIVRYIRIDAVGKAQAIAYNDLDYTPRDADARRDLASWAKARYARLRATVADTYHSNYYFVDKDLAARKMQDDLRSQDISKVLTGQIPENDININSIQFLSLARENVHGTILTGGQALIDFDKIYAATNVQDASREHWLVTVTFYLNPDYAAKRAEHDPKYEFINPLGLCITDFHETSVLN